MCDIPVFDWRERPIPDGFARRISAAILEGAIRDYENGRGLTNPRRSRRFREAESWILDQKSTWLFSFETVCRVLARDPDYLRGQLVRGRRASRNGSRRRAKRRSPRASDLN
jgi:hypothetical protein